MRTIKLTHEQIETIIQALDNRANQCLAKIEEAVKDNEDPLIRKYYHDKYLKYSAISADINAGTLDC